MNTRRSALSSQHSLHSACRLPVLYSTLTPPKTYFLFLKVPTNHYHNYNCVLIIYFLEEKQTKLSATTSTFRPTLVHTTINLLWSNRLSFWQNICFGFCCTNSHWYCGCVFVRTGGKVCLFSWRGSLCPWHWRRLSGSPPETKFFKTGHFFLKNSTNHHHNYHQEHNPTVI